MLTQSSQKSQQVSRNSSGSQPSTLGTQAYAAKKKEVPFVKQVISIDDFNQEEKGEGNGSKNIRVSSAINSKNVVDNKNRINESNATNDKKVVKNSYHNIEVKKTDRNEIIQKGQVSHGIQEKQQLVQQKASEHYLMQLQMKEQMKAIQKAQQLKQQQAKELNMLARKQVIEQLLSQNEQQEGGRMQIKPAEINTADRYRIQKSVDVQDTQKYKLRESQGDRNMQTKQAATEQSSSNNLPKIQTSNSQVENDKKSIRKHPQSSKSIESHEDIQGTSNNNVHSMQRISGGENGREINVKSQNLSEKHIQINNFSSSSSNNNSQAVIQNNSKRLLKHSTESERFPILNKGSQVMKEEEREEEKRAGFEINKSQNLKESQRIQKNKKNEEIQFSKVVQQQDNNQKYKRHQDTRDQDESDENGNDQKSESEDNQSENSNNNKSEDDHFGHDDEGYQESKYKAFGQFESKPVRLQDNSSKLSQESNEQQEDDENEDEVVEREEDTEEGDQNDSDKDHEDQDSQCSVRQKHEEESREEEQDENQSQENDQQDEQENEEEHEGQQEEEEEDDDDEEQQQQSEHSDHDSESEGRNGKKINNLDDNLTFGHHKGSNKQLLHQNFQTFGPNRNNSENISLLQIQKQDNTSRNIEQSQSMQQARNYQDNINNQSIKKSQGNNLEGYQNSGLASTSAFGVLKDKMRELKGGSIKKKGKQTKNEDEEEENSNIRHDSSEGSREEQDRNSDDDNESDEGGYQDQDQYEEENDKQNEEQEEPEWIENKNSQISLDEEEGRNGRNSFDMKFHMAYEQSQEQSFKAAQESQSIIDHNQDNHEYDEHEDDNNGDAQDDFWQGKSSKLKSIKNHKGMDASELQDNEFIKHSILAAHRQTGQQSNLSAKSAQPKQSNHRKAWEKHQQTQQIQGLNWERKSQQQSEENDNDDEEEEDEAIEKNGISEDTKKLSQNELEQEEDNSQQQQQQQVQQQPKGVAMTINFDEDDEDVEKKKKIFEQLRHRKTQEFEINKQKKRLAEQQNQQQQAQQPKEQQYSQQKPQAKSPIGARKTVVEDSLSQAKERQSLPNRLSQISNKPSEKQEKKGTLLNDPIKDQFMLPQKTSSDYPTENQPKNKTSPGILKKKQATVLSQDKQNTDEYKIKTDMADNFAPRPSVSETPTTKPRMPFQKASNKLLISQAISKVCMAGPNQKERETVLNKIKDSPYEHFIVLFKGINGRQDFKAIYAMDNNATEIKKIYGLTTAPQIIESSGIQTFFRYDSGAKEFKELLVKGFSSQVDAILLKK